MSARTNQKAIIPPSAPTGTARLCLWALAIAVAMLFACPVPAFATFRDTSDSYPAEQDLGVLDAPITGDQLPDGNYLVTARTTSRMCIMYTNPDDAESRESKEKAVLVVQGGTMTAVFYISKAYNYLYLGTQEEAAQHTNPEGTDASAYIAGNPADGYVPHLFSLGVSALNTPMTVSTFNGGNKGIEGGQWYTRRVVFTMTSEELRAARSSGASSQTDPAGGEGAGADPGADSQPSVESANTQTELTTDNVSTANPDQTQQQETTDSEASRNASAASGKPGVRLNITEPGAVIDVTNLNVEVPTQPEASRGLSAQQIVVLAVIALAAVGCLARILAFKRSFQRPNTTDTAKPADAEKPDGTTE